MHKDGIMTEKKDSSSFYDRRWQQEEGELSSVDKYRMAWLRDELANHAENSDHELEILDLGCGRGRYTKVAVEYGQVDALDLSEVGVCKTREVAPQANVFQMSATEFVPRKQYDCVLSIEVLEHIPDQERYVDVIRRSLRPGGLLLLTTPNARAARRYWATRPSSAQPIEQWVDQKTLRGYLGQGFTVEWMETRDAEYSSRGIMRCVNSVKANWILSFLGKEPLRKAWCKIGMGCYLFCKARRKQTA